MNPEQLRQRAPWLLLALAALVCTGCSQDSARVRAEQQLAEADLAKLRFDAAVLYKNALPTRGPGLVSVGDEKWPKSFRAFSPARVTVYRDGIALALSMKAERESGLWILPDGITHPPAASPRASYRELREGVFWYEFGRAARSPF